MKKLFTLMAIFASLAAVVCCNPATSDEEEEEEEEQTSKVAITIDGSFADWAALSKDSYVMAQNDPGSPWKAVEAIRVYATTEFVFYYIKFNEEMVKELLANPAEELPIRLCINTDGEFTSGYSNYFLEAYDYIVEGALAEGGEFTDYVGNVHQRIGSWVALEGNPVIGKGSGCEYEIMLVRDLFNAAANSSDDPKPMGLSFETGIRFYCTGGGSWEELSNMPNMAAGDGGNGWGHLLEITVK
ncbi:MAG: hypothetical protein J5748_02690 [Bacteroidales bacterium]|nr:hypothetical protein [Bacteroidales bacterium]